MPYTLTSVLTVSMVTSYVKEYSWQPIPDTWDTHGTITAPAGYNYYDVGQMVLYNHNYFNYGWANQWTKEDYYYDVESPGDASYEELPTVGRDIWIP